MERPVTWCKDEVDKMFFDVLEKADKTRNALLVLNRFKFLFQLPANIRAHLAKEDYDRVSEEYERARALYGNSEEPLFQTYLAEAEKGVQQMKVNILVTQPNIFCSCQIFSLQVTLSAKLREGQLSIEQQKKPVGSLTQTQLLVEWKIPAWSRSSDPMAKSAAVSLDGTSGFLAQRFLATAYILNK